jgi:mRNA interferase RelE/StbE
VPYQIRVSTKAAKALNNLPPPLQKQVRDRINDLKTNPRPSNSETLTGHPGLFRIKSGDYRIIYEFDQGKNMVDLVRIGHRRDIYRNLP